MVRLELVGGKLSPLRTLSKGNAQKVALAQALLVAPQLLVLDEPWSGLDASAHSVLADILAEVSRGGGSVVFADHRVPVTEVHASQTYVISAGRVTRGGMEPARESGQLTEVVLIASSGPNRTREVDRHTIDGVVLVANHPETITIRVAQKHSDALLLTALRHCWSVNEVTPDVREPRTTPNRDAQ